MCVAENAIIWGNLFECSVHIVQHLLMFRTIMAQCVGHSYCQITGFFSGETLCRIVLLPCCCEYFSLKQNRFFFE